MEKKSLLKLNSYQNWKLIKVTIEDKICRLALNFGFVADVSLVNYITSSVLSKKKSSWPWLQACLIGWCHLTRVLWHKHFLFFWISELNFNWCWDVDMQIAEITAWRKWIFGFCWILIISRLTLKITSALQLDHSLVSSRSPPYCSPQIHFSGSNGKILKMDGPHVTKAPTVHSQGHLLLWHFRWTIVTKITYVIFFESMTLKEHKKERWEVVHLEHSRFCWTSRFPSDPDMLGNGIR